VTGEKGQTRREAGTQSYGSLRDRRIAERDMKMTSSHPDKDNPRGAGGDSADKATTRPKKGAPGKEGERWLRSPTEATGRKRAEEALKESEERFRIAFEDAPVGVALVDLDGHRFRANRALCEMLGCSEQDLLGTDYLEYVHPEDREISTEHFRRTLEEGAGTYTLERRYVHADGHVVWNLTSVSLIRDSKGQPSYFVCFHQDITERKRAEKALQESEQRFRNSFRDAAIGMALVGTDGRWLQINRALCRIVGYPEEELLEKTFQEITHPEDLDADLGHVRRMLAGEIETYQMEKRYLHKEGHVIWILLSVSMVHDEDGEPLYLIAQIQDISERQRMEEQLRHQAFHDRLTDLPNRHLFMDGLERALRRTRRRRRGRKVAVLYLDLDDFKVVNDSLGHEAGDLLLVMAGERLRWCLRPEDTLARFGGDEFAVLLEEVEAPSDAAKVAERIAERFREPFVLEGREFVIKPSLGIAVGTARQKTAEELLRDADTAMYQAKEQDAGYRVFDPNMYEQALRRLKLESDLRRAIEDEEFVLCYQPIVDLNTGETWRMEALVRWQHPEQEGLLAPSQFVPIAEEAGLVVPMGRWVLEEACRQGAKWQREHPRTPPLVMCVNLSAKQLQHPDVAQTVEETLKETGFEAHCLSLDITETLYIETLRGNTAVLDKLKKMGVRISIDDFGVGYSSLAYLKRLPADTLKIDKSFIKGLGEDLEDTAIVQMIIDLAHTLGMEVIAEGVEREEQVEQLKEMSCDFGQGYHLARPLPSQATSEFLAAWSSTSTS
jgi:diguanylate cyclase (GGDEF)-like protein/PAS domain S-box-containing protein